MIHGMVHLGDDMTPCYKYTLGYLDIWFGIGHGYGYGPLLETYL
jgi:hypothetical protein